MVPAQKEHLYVAFGERLRELRSTKDLTQAALGRRVGLTRTSITNIEAGRQHISLGVLYRLADALGEPAGALLPLMDNYLAEEPGGILHARISKLAAPEQQYIRRLAEGSSGPARAMKGA